MDRKFTLRNQPSEPSFLSAQNIHPTNQINDRDIWYLKLVRNLSLSIGGAIYNGLSAGRSGIVARVTDNPGEMGEGVASILARVGGVAFWRCNSLTVQNR